MTGTDFNAAVWIRRLGAALEDVADHGSESLRYVATATQNGKPRHAIGKYGGPEVCDELFREMTTWLTRQGRQAPDHYWWQQFPK